MSSKPATHVTGAMLLALAWTAHRHPAALRNRSLGNTDRSRNSKSRVSEITRVDDPHNPLYASCIVTIEYIQSELKQNMIFRAVLMDNLLLRVL